jgi:hypothetical protein
MERYLKQPPREPDYRQGRSHADFVGTLNEGKGEGAERLAAALERALSQIDLEEFIGQEKMSPQQSERLSLPDALLTK